MFVKMFIGKEYVEKYGKYRDMSKKTKKLTYQLTHVNLSLLFFAAKFRLKENMHLNIFLPQKNHTYRSN